VVAVRKSTKTEKALDAWTQKNFIILEFARLVIELIDRLDQWLSESVIIKTDSEYVLHLEKYYWHAHALLMLP
jgi:hypothetical protein